MTDTLIHAYGPLLFWPGVGFLLFVILPEAFPRWLGRSLYWVGVPLEILTLARQTPFSAEAGLSPLFTIGALLGGVPLAWLGLQGIRRGRATILSASQPAKTDSVDETWPSQAEGEGAIALPSFFETASSHQPLWEAPSRRGSFMLSSVISNTGFVGLAIAPLFISDDYLSWVVIYSVTHNVVGTYGVGVLLASYYGRSQTAPKGWTQQLRDLFTVPSLWAFAIGLSTRSIALPNVVELSLHHSIGVIIPAALMLMGMRVSQIRGWESLKLALLPAALKALVLPLLVGGAAVLLQLSAEPRLAVVMMAGMPTAFAGLILAEEYNLDRELIASSIVLSTSFLLITIPLWLVVFGQPG